MVKLIKENNVDFSTQEPSHNPFSLFRCFVRLFKTITYNLFKKTYLGDFLSLFPILLSLRDNTHVRIRKVIKL